MKTVFLYLYLILLVSSIFFISADLANPSDTTSYLAIIGSCLLVIGGVVLRYKQRVFSLSISEVLLCVITIAIGITVFYGSFNIEFLLSLLSLYLFFILTKRIRLSHGQFCIGITFLGFAQSIYGLGQYFYILPDIAAPSFRISGCFDNPAGFAATSIVCFPFALCLVREQKFYYKVAGVVSSLAIIVGILLAQSRAGVVALLLITSAWSISLLAGKWREWYKPKTIIVFISIVAMLLIVGLYFWKKDSADGRLLIWQCSARMIAEKPLLGHGIGGFQREYMLYQAEYFKMQPDSKYSRLADIVKHPFNEYLLIWIEQGIVGVLLWSTMGWLVIRAYIRNRNVIGNNVFMLCLLGIAVFACFSYPLNYPFVRLMLTLSAAFIMRSEPVFVNISFSIARVLKLLVLAVLVGVITLTGWLFYSEYYWNKIAQQSLAGETRKMLPQYAQLYPRMRNNGLFLYNYAAELNYIGEWGKSNQLMIECSQLYNDNDVQLILADNYQQQKQYAEAERHLKLACLMIPNRFIPPYRLVQLYKLQGRDTDVQKLARQIVDKQVKIPSSDIVEIKREMQKLIN